MIEILKTLKQDSFAAELMMGNAQKNRESTEYAYQKGRWHGFNKAILLLNALIVASKNGLTEEQQ